jgi:hypothetical protein
MTGLPGADLHLHGACYLCVRHTAQFPGAQWAYLGYGYAASIWKFASVRGKYRYCASSRRIRHAVVELKARVQSILWKHKISPIPRPPLQDVAAKSFPNPDGFSLVMANGYDMSRRLDDGPDDMLHLD